MDHNPEQPKVPQQLASNQAVMGPWHLNKILDSWNGENLGKIIIVAIKTPMGPLIWEYWTCAQLKAHFRLLGQKQSILTEIPSCWVPPAMQVASSTYDFDTFTALVKARKSSTWEGVRLLGTRGGTTELMFSDCHLYVFVEQGGLVIVQPHFDTEFLDLYKSNLTAPIVILAQSLRGKPVTRHLVPQGQGGFIPPACLFYFTCTQDSLITLRRCPMKPGTEPPYCKVMEQFKKVLPVPDPVGYLNGGDGSSGLPPRTEETQAALTAEASPVSAQPAVARKSSPQATSSKPRVTRSRAIQKGIRDGKAKAEMAEAQDPFEQEPIENPQSTLPVTSEQLVDVEWEKTLDVAMERAGLNRLS